MNYEILPGKEGRFEQVFEGVVALMKTLPGHEETRLYKDVANGHMYLIVSQWSDRAAFDAFIGSDRFRKVVDWGKEGILAGRPSHQVYGEDKPAPPSGCPMH
jgi:heme-degrading monooxygenase HmoA